MKQLERSILMSLISLTLCFSMLVGSTYAWFTDTVESDTNILQAGVLNADMYWSSTYDGDTSGWKSAATGSIFNYDKWEPGYTEIKYIKIVNKANLPFKWDIFLESSDNNLKLAEVIDVYYFNPVSANISELLASKRAGTLLEVINQHKSTAGVLLPKGETSNTLPSGEIIIGIALHMKEGIDFTAYKNLSVGNGFSVKLMATQYSDEQASVGDNTNDSTLPDNTVTDSNKASVTIIPTYDNKTSEMVTMISGDGKLTASLPAGVLLDVGTSKLTLSVKKLTSTQANITVSENENILAIDVHLDGVSDQNNEVITIGIKELLPIGLNIGNYRFYHVENGETVEMTLLQNGEIPVHNKFSYDPATGDVTLYLASFSEITMITDKESVWEGGYDYSWYSNDPTISEYIIANADQLAGFGRIVGGMAEGIDCFNFENKTVKLITNINLGDKDNANDNVTFTPIGYYYTEDKDKNGTNKIYSTVKSFEGTFDGNGKTISNFYQSTWEIKGDTSDNHYSDGFGLFGLVLNGTVKNLTVDSFSSDGEFTATGVIAAYARNSSFENITVTNCNPRVFNSGNGGIVGIGGAENDTAASKLTFINVNVDNTNKISALRESWDVLCGGIMGTFSGNGLVEFTNCNVAAQIDVYSNVCSNNQNNWYRYSGMLIGTIYRTVTIGEHTYPDTTGITTKDCTVHFGNLNDYYYCELVTNSIASATHEHQFSRLTVIESLDEIKSGDSWIKSGNFLLIDGDSKTCYHIIKGSDGKLIQHLHEDAGTEEINGETVLKEDNQIVYLPFNQLFQSNNHFDKSSIPIYDDGTTQFNGITILDREPDELPEDPES